MICTIIEEIINKRGVSIIFKRTTKVKSTYQEMMLHIKTKGIQFNDINGLDAQNTLQYTNYYYKLLSYKINLRNYNNLKNSCLFDLSTIDMRLRYIFLHMGFRY